MQEMIASLADRPLATAFGLMGMACLIAWPLFATRTRMLLAQIGIGVGMGIHFFLLGAWTGALMNGLSALQTAAAIPLADRPGLRKLYLALVPVIGVAAALTWNGWPSLFAALGMTLLTVGRMQTDTRAMRILLLAAIPFWAAHDLMVGSVPGLAADALSLCTGLWSLRRPAVKPPVEAAAYSANNARSRPTSLAA